MSTPGQQVWRLPEEVQLLWRTWGDEVIVYNIASQQTHLLDAFSAATLREIEAAPQTMEALGGRLAKALDRSPGTLSVRLTETCAKFMELGLVEPTRQ